MAVSVGSRYHPVSPASHEARTCCVGKAHAGPVSRTNPAGPTQVTHHAPPFSRQLEGDIHCSCGPELAPSSGRCTRIVEQLSSCHRCRREFYRWWPQIQRPRRHQPAYCTRPAPLVCLSCCLKVLRGERRCLVDCTVCACASSRWFMHATARDVSSTMATAMLFGPITRRDAPDRREILALSCNMRARIL